MARNTRNFSRSDEESDKDTIQRLKAHVKSLYKKIDDLETENKTLLDAWAKTEVFLQEVTNGVPLEDLLRMRKLPKRVLKGKDKKVKKQDENDKRQETLEKWQRWNKERGNE